MTAEKTNNEEMASKMIQMQLNHVTDADICMPATAPQSILHDTTSLMCLRRVLNENCNHIYFKGARNWEVKL